MVAEKHPEVKVKLVGRDSNVYNLMGIVIKAMRRAHIADQEILEFEIEATADDYDHFLRTCMKWVKVL